MKKLLLGVAFATLLALPVEAAQIPYFTSPSTNEPSQINSTLNQLINTLNNQLGTSPGVDLPKNVLDNGAMKVDIRGTSTQTCGTTSGVVETAYSADRWACDVNVTSGAGRMAVATSSPTPPLGFQNEETLWRVSGALTQPVCAWQEVPTYKVVTLQGQAVIFSTFAEALAGLAADNGNAANLVVISGTGTDEGLGSLRSAVGMTASPAITPAFTGLSTLVNTPITLSASNWARFNTGLVAVPITAKELAVAICFTPTATGAGATDGLAFTGAQLEAIGLNGTAPTAFETKTLSAETLEAEQYAYAWPEAASGVAQLSGAAVSTTSCEFSLHFAVPMAVAPTLSQIGTAIAGGTTYKVNQGGTLFNVSAMATQTANSTTDASFDLTVATLTSAAPCFLQGLAGGAIPMWGADF